MRGFVLLGACLWAIVFTAPPAHGADALDLDGIWNVTIGEALTVKLLGVDSATTATTMTFDAAGAAGGSFSYDLEAGGQDFAPTGSFSMIGGGKKFAWSFDSPGATALSSYLKAWIVEWLQSGGHSVDAGSLSLSLQALTSKPMKVNRASGAPLTGALKVKGALSGTIDGAARTLKLKYAATYTFSSEVGLDTQLTDASNWQVIATFDQKDTSGTPAYETSGLRRKQAKGTITNPQLAIRETGNRIYTASGLVSDILESIYVDDDTVIVGNRESGFSRIAIEDLADPRGKVCNYKGRDGSDALLRIGFSGATKGQDGRIYAWYGNDIVDAVSHEIVFEDAPEYMHNPGAGDRYVSDENGDFWIGACNIDPDGNLYPGDKWNGLFRIPSNFSGISTVIADLPVWSIYKDPSGVIWIASRSGIHRRAPGGSPVRVYDSSQSGIYPEQVIAFNGQIYAVMKNRFNDIWIPAVEREFEFHRWNAGSSQFEKVCDIITATYSGSRRMQAFVFSGKLYLSFQGRTDLFEFDPPGNRFVDVPRIGESMGQERYVPAGDALYSIGFPEALTIYNLNGDDQTLQRTSVNTAEGLITDITKRLYSGNGRRLYIAGQAAGGFNIYDRGVFEIYDVGDVDIAGFFEHGGNSYVHGTGSLYRLENNQLNTVIDFYTNGEKSYYDQGQLWAATNLSSSGYGGIALLDLDSLWMKSSGDVQGSSLWNADETWTLDRGYHFYDVIAVPHEDAVFFAVGDRIDDISLTMPYVLKYSYTGDSFTKIYLPDSGSEGIRAFASDGRVVYGAARQKLFIYENGAWQEFCDLEIGNDFRGMKIANKHLFIISGWGGYGSGEAGGMEVVDLREKTTRFYDSTTIPILADPLYSIEIESVANNIFKLWLGGPNGIAFCEFHSEE